ncbi:MAG TPA: hypothetical protein VHZ55_10195 [Bryobacteraceae bacterium]|jgi:hypothetical protein|nr:hypothetical protein [Bryobacteraceae bacterium]
MASPTSSSIETEQSPRKPAKTFARRIRDLHLYLGTFFAPAILFFAFTGSLQTFGLHEHHDGQAYQPPAWIVRLARIHKDQTKELPPPRPEPGDRPREQRRPPAGRPAAQQGDRTATTVMKWFVLLMAVGLATTTLLGIYMAYAFTQNKRVTSILLAAGVVLPLAILLA